MTDVEGSCSDRPGTTTCASPAEVACGLVVASSTVSVHVAGDPAVVLVNMHRTDTGGRLLLAVPEGTTLAARTAAGAVAAQGLLIDVAPVAVRERERARLELSGQLYLLPREGAAAAWAGSHPAGGRLGHGEVLLRLDPRALVLHRSGLGAVDVGVEEYSRARCDPLARHEAEILQRLVSARPRALCLLTRLVPARLVRAADRVVPLSLDRHRVVLRLESAAGHVDAVLPLPDGLPALTVDDALSRVRALLCSACVGRASGQPRRG